MKRRILLVAGEASGDLHAAHLATEIKKLYPDIDITGMGQARMEKCGVRLYVRSDEIAVVGVLEVLKYAGKIRAIFKGNKGCLRCCGFVTTRLQSRDTDSPTRYSIAM